MFSACGIASIFLKRGLTTSKSIVVSGHSNIYCFRPSMNKIQRSYCGAKIALEQASKVKKDNKLKDEILEILESPDKMERDHKHYRSAIYNSVENVMCNV